MTIISTGFSSRTQILLSRQSCEISKQEVETALFNFIKQLDLHSGDHTYFESKLYRYIYQPIETLYIFIITTRDSNVIEDLEVVKMLSQIAQNVTKQCVSEKTIMENLFDLIFYMDEIIIDGNREALTMDQLEHYISMESQEEKLQLMLIKNKEKEEKERRRQIATKLDKEKQRKKLDTYLASSAQITNAANAFNSIISSDASRLNINNALNLEPEGYLDPQVESIFGIRSEMPFSGGMQLSKPKQTKKLKDLALETGFNPQPLTHPSNSSYSLSQLIERESQIISKINSDTPLQIQVEEKCNGLIDIERDLSKLTYQGSLMLTVYDTSIASSASLQLEIGDNCKFKPKYHPNLNKSKISDGLLELNSDDCPFRLGSPVSLVKWRHDANDPAMPFSVSCWPSGDSLETMLSVEITNSDETELSNVSFQFNCPRTVKTAITNSAGAKIYHENDIMYWEVGCIPINESKTIGFSAHMDLDSLLPFNISVETSVNYFNIKVKNCFDKNSGDEIKHKVVHKTVYNLKVDRTG